MDLIKMNMERDDTNTSTTEPPQRSCTDTVNTSISQHIFHETSGWRNLETSMKCLQYVVQGCGYSFLGNIDSDLLELIYNATRHTNRFVRETGYHTLASIIEVASAEYDPSSDSRLFESGGVEAMETDKTQGQQFHPCANPIINVHGTSMSKVLAEGLADNWSQVRLSASVASRSFLTSIPTSFPEKPVIHALMLPRVCLNRYYLAEGVRIYSQETWRLVTSLEEGGGRKVVERHLEDVVQYYIASTKADNHAVREAACQCIAELAVKIDKASARPHVDTLLDTLLECFNDDSWPVRDMACVAAGKFILNFPEPSKRCLSELQDLFLINLQDAISSVRQGAALALANMVRAYEKDESQNIWTGLISKIEHNLDMISKQSSESKRFGGLETSSTQSNFGVAKRMRDNDPDLHSDQTMYSCGSLAPKMNRGGCSDCKFRKEPEPWEVADGSVLLLCELTHICSCREKIVKSNLMPKLADACRHRHYVAHNFFLETVLKSLPLIGHNLGKRPIKMYLEEFLDHIFYAAECESALASTAALKCLRDLSDLLGPNIMRGRVENHNPRYLNILHNAMDFDAENNFMPGSCPIPGMNPAAMHGGMPRTTPIAVQKEPSLGGTPTGSPI